MKPTKTGFLTDYSRLHVDPNDSDRLYYENLNARNRQTRFVHIAPSVYRPSENDAENPPSAESVSKLKAYLDGAMKEEFKKRGFQIVPEPLRGSVHVKTAITGINTVRPVLNGVTTFILTPVDNGGVSVETEILDPSSGEVIYAEAVSTRGGPLQGKIGKQMLGYYTRHGHAEAGLWLIAERAAESLAHL